MNQQTKQCSKCGEVKPLDAFHKQQQGALGVRSTCKACRIEEKKIYRQENRVAINAKQAEYRKTHAKQIAQRNKKYRSSCREKINETRNEWRKKNRNLENAIKRRNRDKNKAAINSKKMEKYYKNPTKYSNLAKKYISSLPDSYIVRIICRGSLLKPDEITQELIDMKREQLLMHRATKQLMDSLKEKENGTE